MEIVIALDTYDDLFSDFDIRDYRERAISIDFLDELHLRARKVEEGGKLDIVLLMPAQDRNERDERLIIERLREFFAERYTHYSRKNSKSKRESLVFVTIGLAVSVAANVIADRFDFLPLFKDFLLIPSWFFVWSGLEQFIKNREEFVGKRRYYVALSESSATFSDKERY